MSQNAGFAPSNFPGGFVQTLTGDIGGPVPPTGGNINVITNVAIDNSGSSIEFTGNPGTSTLTLNVTDADDNTLIGRDSGNGTLSGSDNTGLGFSSLSSLTSGLFNTGIGSQAGLNLSSGSNNTLLGAEVAVNLLSGSSNIIIGNEAGNNYVAAESDNIILDNDGVVGDNTTIRIGEEGFHTRAFMAGINGAVIGTPASVVIDMVTGQLGTAGGGGTPIETISGNDGIPESPDGAGNFNIVTANATAKFLGTANTETLDFGLTNLALGSSTPSATINAVHNAALGLEAMESITDGSSLVAVGWSAMAGVTTAGESVAVGALALGGATFTGGGCVAVGDNAMHSATSANGDVALGQNALFSLSSGNQNVALGSSSLNVLLTGSNNICIGNGAFFGNNYIGAESSNILIASDGIIGGGENNVIRIGTYGVGGGQQNKCFIASAFSNFGTQNTFVGEQSGNITLTVVSAIGNTAVGFQSLDSLTTGAANTCMGQSAGTALTTGDHNVAIGLDSLDSLPGGDDNVVVGDSSGTAYTTTESNNIILGANIAASAGEDNTIRIGNTSNNRCFVQGIVGNTITGPQTVVIDPTDGQLGVIAGGGLVTWSVITANQTAVVNNGYFSNKAATPLLLALPATSAVGDVIKVININTATGTQFTQAAGQQIFVSTASTTLGATGTLTSSAIGDTMTLVCRTANTIWWAESFGGAWTTA